MSDKRPSLSRMRFLANWVVIATVYFTLALAGLSDQDFDGDELITSYSIRRGSVVDVVQHRFRAGHPPLYFVTARVWVQHFGATGRSLHRLSVFIGALTLLAMAALARELGLGRWSEPAALLWAVHPVLQFDARYARPMIGVMLGAILALWLMAIALRRDSRTAWGALLTIGLLGALWSPQFMLVWASLAAAVAIAPQWRRTRAAWLVLGAIAIAHGAVSGYTATATVRNPLTWIPPPQGFVWIGSFLDGIGGYGIPGPSTNRIERFAYDSSMILPLCTIVAVLVGVVRLARRGLKPNPWLLVTAATIIPAVALTVATVSGKPLLEPRYMVPLVPGAFLFLVRGLATIRPVRLGVFCAAALSALMICGAADNNARHQYGCRAAILELEDRIDRSKDKVVVTTYMMGEAVKLFAHHKIKNVSFPPGAANASAEKIERTLGRPPRIWVLESNHRNVTNTGEWTKYAGDSFYNNRFGHIRLRGFNLLHASADSPTAGPAQATASSQ